MENMTVKVDVNILLSSLDLITNFYGISQLENSKYEMEKCDEAMDGIMKALKEGGIPNILQMIISSWLDYKKGCSTK